MVKKNDLMIVVDEALNNAVSLEELCDICDISADDINELIAYDIIHMPQNTPDLWIFNVAHVQRIKTAMRLQRDLEINLAGVALALELLDELDELRERDAFFQWYFTQL